ncbi:MAG: hypothetical protein K6D02_01505 [Lachnospiraceae bacterium]|nr:hypothetical protein [Lachnospiraceae bacterium]
MGRYEDSVKLAQIRQLVTEKKYNKASGLLRTIGVKQINAARDLKACALTYSKVGQYQLSRELYEKLYKKEKSKLNLQQLVYVCIKLKDFDDATFYYGQFANMSKSKRDNLILYYRIQQAKGAPVEELISILEDLKEEEYLEEWAYELAKLYQKAGRNEDCRKECENIKTWFGTGEIVERATLLLTYLKVNANLPDYRDKDYTIKEEAPNPLDTGTIPPLDPEILKAERRAEKEKKRRRKEDREAFLIADSEEGFLDDDFLKELEAMNLELEQEQALAAEKEGENEVKNTEDENTTGSEEKAGEAEGSVEASNQEDKADTLEEEKENALSDSNPSGEEGEEGTGSDYSGEEGANQESGAEEATEAGEEVSDTNSNNPAEEALQSLAKAGAGGDEGDGSNSESEEKIESFPIEAQQKFIGDSESGTGITQDLSKEISAIMDNLDSEEVTEDKPKEPEVEAPVGMSEINPNDTGDIISAAAANAGETMDKVAEAASDAMDEAADNADEAMDKAFSLFKSDDDEAEDATATEAAEAVSAEEKGEEKTEDSDMSQFDNVMPEPDLPESKQVKPKKRGGLFGFGKKKNVDEVAEEATPAVDDNKLREGELPTSKAIHKGIGDILTLIRGELEPTNYVLAGTGDERILGISKKIVRIMNQKGFLSSTRIALIKAEQLNNIDLNTAKEQLKGGCLLISDASKLMFSKTQEIINIMDEFAGDFCVILSDDGDTLDSLFKVTPALSSRFQYVIDVTQYGPAEYM